MTRPTIDAAAPAPSRGGGVPTWPQNGRCGACGQPARAYPSGRWDHTGRPCRGRTQATWRVDDAALIVETLRFIPEGEPLPNAPDEWRAWLRYETEGAS